MELAGQRTTTRFVGTGHRDLVAHSMGIVAMTQLTVVPDVKVDLAIP